MTVAEQFKMTFGKHLQAFVSPTMGFDVIQFDDFIAPPDGVSCADRVESEYGLAAVQLVRRIMDLAPCLRVNKMALFVDDQE